MENSRPDIGELQGVSGEKVKKAFAEYQQGCQWFRSALDKYDITHDRKLKLGGKVEYSVSTAVLTSFQSFSFSASSKWTVRPASMLLKRWINCLSLFDATDLEAMHCLHLWNISNVSKSNTCNVCTMHFSIIPS